MSQLPFSAELATQNSPSSFKRLLEQVKVLIFGPRPAVSPAIKLEAVLRAMRDAVFICDNAGKIADFNEAFATFHRFKTRAESISHVSGYVDLIEVASVDGLLLAPRDWPVARVLRGEETVSADYLLRRKDTGESWVGSYSCAAIRGASSSIVGVIGVARDITEQRRNEEQLRNVSSRLHLAVSSAHLGVWDWDVSGDRMFWDDRMLELYGITRDSFSGRVDAWTKPLHPDDRDRASSEVQSALKGEKEFDTEFRVLHGDGTIRYLKASGIVLRAPDGTALRMLGVNADITEERSSQERLQQAYAEVEAKVIERTSQLEAAKISAENASRAKDLFLATLSHELRTPLNAILSWSQLMERGLPPEKMQAAIRTIKENVWSQNQLISDLLDISRIVTGKLNVDKQPIAADEVLRAAVETIRATAEQRELIIEEHFEDASLFILADPARLKQALWNILTNAVKFTPAGGRIIVSLASRNLTAPSEVRFSIRDTGKGINPKFLPHLFDRFSQADSSSVRIHGGMGLGLSLVRSLVELQGGTVQAESPGEGAGATFTVSFPLLGKASAGTPPFLVSSPPASPGQTLSNINILLVEDSDKTRVALAELLASRGAHVEAAASAKEAFSALDSFRPDIIVSDIAMPQEDGHSLIRRLRLREASEGRKTPAIALTAYGEPRDREEAFASGFQEYLVKPVEADTLATAILKLQDRNAPAASPIPASQAARAKPGAP